jgi:hypothetical protein
MKLRFLILSASSLVWITAMCAQTIPVPVPRPQIKSPEIPILPPPTISAPSWNAASACALDLKKLGVKFKILLPINEASGCAIAEPVEISALLDNVALILPATLDCPTALQLVKFTHDIIQTKSIAILGSPIKTIVQASAYVCRTRNGTSKLSEHAYGRAIDIGSFVTMSGKIVPVKTLPVAHKVEAQFLDAVRDAACGPFTTVLGPGSDADHALHFHFDMAPRKGKAYCTGVATK